MEGWSEEIQIDEISMSGPKTHVSCYRHVQKIASSEFNLDKVNSIWNLVFCPIPKVRVNQKIEKLTHHSLNSSEHPRESNNMFSTDNAFFKWQYILIHKCRIFVSVLAFALAAVVLLFFFSCCYWRCLYYSLLSVAVVACSLLLSSFSVFFPYF